jgi:phage baseplate assembly protein W
MATTEAREFLGKGWKFPLQVTPAGRIAWAASEQRIEESIYLILSTAVEERLMLPEFGCGIHNLVFSPNNAAATTRLVHEIRSALTRSEPRIDVLELDATSPEGEPNLLLIRINYRIRANNAVGNMVYPFFIKEGA